MFHFWNSKHSYCFPSHLILCRKLLDPLEQDEKTNFINKCLMVQSYQKNWDNNFFFLIPMNLIQIVNAKIQNSKNYGLAPKCHCTSRRHFHQQGREERFWFHWMPSFFCSPIMTHAWLWKIPLMIGNLCSGVTRVCRKREGGRQATYDPLYPSQYIILILDTLNTFKSFVMHDYFKGLPSLGFKTKCSDVVTATPN